MNKLIIIPLAALVFLLIDWYVFQAVKVSFQNTSQTVQHWVRNVYWGITVVALTGFFLYHFTNPEFLGRFTRQFILVGLFMNYFSKIFVVLFLFIDDIIRFFRWIASFFTTPDSQAVTQSSPTSTVPTPPANGISRSEFLMKTALIVGAVPAAAMTWGILSGAHDYRIRRVRLALRNLPKSFDGLKIAQISDIHSGSFFNKTAVKGGIDMLLGEKPDMIFFTGDLVNNVATEVQDYINIFDKVKAPMGVYSTLGNHDYGDYAQWSSPHAKKQNLEDLKKAHKLLGWDLLLDENRIVTESGDKIALIGVQNWGAGRFSKYGDIKKAYQGAEDYPVKLLLSHDPTHWDAQIRPNYPDINAMFSGHTHGTQFGVKVGDWEWSPAQYVYKQWAGMYQEGEQYLYVNRGYGYIGYPGRIGMPPEITIFELKSV